jgi:hypothetical protein
MAEARDTWARDIRPIMASARATRHRNGPSNERLPRGQSKWVLGDASFKDTVKWEYFRLAARFEELALSAQTELEKREYLIRAARFRRLGSLQER